MIICLTAQEKFGSCAFSRTIDVDSQEKYIEAVKEFEKEVPFKFGWAEREPNDVEDFEIFDVWDEALFKEKEKE
jgi:hypothetical protein